MVHQSSLCYKDLFDTTPFCCIINKCQTHTSDELEKCVNSVVFYMSKFILNHEHSRTLIFCFYLKKTVAEWYRLFRQAYGEHDPSQDTCERRFRHFKSETSQLQTRKMENRQKHSNLCNYKHYCTKMIRKYKHNSLRKWALAKKLFPIDYERWERFRRPVDGYYMSWTTVK